MADPAQRSPTGRQTARAVVASTIGASLEWYDFTLYGLASSLVLGPVFFPSDSTTKSLLASFATFGVGFFARPIGGIVFGHFGDRIGRRRVLVITLILMSISTFAIGILPSPDSVGILAPILLVVLRIAQGFGAGAEYAGATLLAAEYAPPSRRGVLASVPPMGSPIGSLLASAVFGAFAALPNEQFHAWGWRIPFLLSVVLFAFGLYVRLHISETPVFTSQQPLSSRRVGIVELLRKYPVPALKALMLNTGPNVTSYLPATYGVAYLSNTLGMPPTAGTKAMIIANAASIIVLPIAGSIADRVKRTYVFCFGAGLAIVMAFPFFALLNTGHTLLIWLGYVLMFAIAGQSVIASQASLLSEQFPTEVRYSGVAVTRELASALVGGTLPFIATAMVSLTGGTTGVAILTIVIGLIAAIGALLMHDHKGESLAQVARR